MKKYTAQTLTDEGYTIENAQITNVSLSTTNYCCLSLDLTLKAASWDVVYGGYCLGKVYPDSYEKILTRVLPSVWRLSCASWMSSVFPVWKT